MVAILVMFHLPSRFEVLVVVSICSILGVFVMLPVLNARPAGDAIPREAPDPNDRIDTGIGVSIILPKNWVVSEHSHSETDNTFSAWPQTAYGQRSSASIHLHRCLDEPDFDYLPVISVHFGEGTAKQFVHVYETNSIPVVSNVQTFLQSDQQWWRLTYVYHGTITKNPESVQAFLETIRFDSEGSVGETDTEAMR